MPKAPEYRQYHIPNVQGVPIEGRRFPVLSMRTDEVRAHVTRIAEYIESAEGEVPVEHIWRRSATDGRSLLLDIWWDNKRDDLHLAFAFDPELNGVTMILGLIIDTGIAILTPHPIEHEEDLIEGIGLAVAGLDEGLPK